MSKRGNVFRPIGLLDRIGKVCEKVIATKLDEAIAAAGGFSSNQYGFRKELLTLDAISTVTNAARVIPD